MRRLFDVRLLLCLMIPFLLAWAPHDGGGSGKNIGNSAPPGIGGDGPWESQNMILLGRLSLPEIGAVGANVMGSDCWGWTDAATGKEYAICGLTNATSFVDISDPTNPLYLGQLLTQTGNSAWRDMKVFNDHVFIVSDGNGNHGMQIFDLTQLRNVDPANPQSFSNTAWYDGGTGSCHNLAINEDTGYAYLNGSDQASGGLQVVDISNPIAPFSAGDFAADGYTHDSQVVSYIGPDSDYARREIAFCCNEDTVTIVDVTNKNNMVQISRNGYPEDNYTHQGWLSEDQRYFYMGDELDESNRGGPTRTHIFDCLDLDNPVYKGYYSGTTNSIDHNLYVKGNRLFCGNYSSGMRVLEQDPNDGSILTEVAFFDSYNLNNGVNFDGVWSVYPYFDSETILINDRQGGMFLVRLSQISIEADNIPTLIDPAGVIEFDVEVSDFEGTAAPGTGILHVDKGDGNGYQPYPMTEIKPGCYQAEFPPTDCATEVNFYVSAAATNGEILCLPSTAPTEAWTARSAREVTTTFLENFESATGWVVTGDAGDGQWELGVPVGGGDRGDPANDSDGSGSCFLTDNEDGNSDVDDGHTILTSATFDASTGPDEEALLSYDRWYSNSSGGNPAADIMDIDISNDGGNTWVDLETVGPTGSGVSGGWITATFRVSDFVVPTSNMKLRFDVSDLDGGSLVEAGIDALEVRMVQCAEVVTAFGSKFLDGIITGGTTVDLDESDDQYLDLIPSPTNNLSKQLVEVIVQGDSPTSDPTGMSLRVESFMQGAPVGEVIQKVYFFNELTRRFEMIDARPVTDTDTLIEVSGVGDVSRYVHPVNDEITARVRWDSVDATQTWSLTVDQIVWVISD